MEAIDDELYEEEKIEHMDVEGLKKMPHPEKGAWLLVQFGADKAEEVREASKKFKEWLTRKKGYAADRIGPGGLAASRTCEFRDQHSRLVEHRQIYHGPAKRRDSCARPKVARRKRWL